MRGILRLPLLETIASDQIKSIHINIQVIDEPPITRVITAMLSILYQNTWYTYIHACTSIHLNYVWDYPFRFKNRIIHILIFTFLIESIDYY